MKSVTGKYPNYEQYISDCKIQQALTSLNNFCDKIYFLCKVIVITAKNYDFAKV